MTAAEEFSHDPMKRKFHLGPLLWLRRGVGSNFLSLALVGFGVALHAADKPLSLWPGMILVALWFLWLLYSVWFFLRDLNTSTEIQVDGEDLFLVTSRRGAPSKSMRVVNVTDDQRKFYLFANRGETRIRKKKTPEGLRRILAARADSEQS